MTPSVTGFLVLEGMLFTLVLGALVVAYHYRGKADRFEEELELYYRSRRGQVMVDVAQLNEQGELVVLKALIPRPSPGQVGWVVYSFMKGAAERWTFRELVTHMGYSLEDASDTLRINGALEFHNTFCSAVQGQVGESLLRSEE